MKVIKKGDGRKGWAKEFTCTGSGNGKGGCGAELLVEQNDLYHTYSHARDETDTFTTFRCPECKCESDVKVPSSVKIREKESTPSMSFEDKPSYMYSGGDKG